MLAFGLCGILDGRDVGLSDFCIVEFFLLLAFVLCGILDGREAGLSDFCLLEFFLLTFSLLATSGGMSRFWFVIPGVAFLRLFFFF